jgi:hypothetical protein
MQKYLKVLPYLILVIGISSVSQWSDLIIGNTLIWWCIKFIIYICFIKVYIIKKYPQAPYPIIKIFLFCVLISAIYGAVFMSENYWDWKSLVSNLFAFCLPFVTFIYNDPEIVSKTIKVWLKYALIIYLPWIPFLHSDAHAHYFMPLTLLALFFFNLNTKYKIYIIVVFVWILMMGTESRSSILRFTGALSISMIYLVKKYKIRNALYKSLHFSMLSLPLVLFGLAITNVFNVFNMDEYLSHNYVLRNENGSEFNPTVDTRTFLYEEEIRSALSNKYLWHGRSLARGYNSIVFTEVDEITKTSRGERYKCEVSILNVFNYLGIIGVVLYFFIFIQASYLAIYKSNNDYVKILALYVSFRWIIAWIEDFNNMDLNYLFLWIMIGMCFSSAYRKMTNIEFNNWLLKTIKAI